MSNIIIFDKVTKKVKEYITSVNTPDYSFRDDVLINPVLPPNVAYKFLKAENGCIVEMTQDEKDIIIAEEETNRITKIRADAKYSIDNFMDLGLVLRALADVIKDEINILRNEHGLPARTLTQLKIAIKDRIDNGSVD